MYSTGPTVGPDPPTRPVLPGVRMSARPSPLKRLYSEVTPMASKVRSLGCSQASSAACRLGCSDGSNCSAMIGRAAGSVPKWVRRRAANTGSATGAAATVRSRKPLKAAPNSPADTSEVGMDGVGEDDCGLSIGIASYAECSSSPAGQRMRTRTGTIRQAVSQLLQPKQQPHAGTPSARPLGATGDPAGIRSVGIPRSVGVKQRVVGVQARR
jgi:hypothetical protein